jgi:acetolactate synthase-1/3 small subunit
MTNPPSSRSAQTDAPEGSEQAHTLMLLVNDRPGSVDRVIGLLRRRRANMQMLVLSQSERPDRVRITVGVNDSNVGVEHLVEQLRKVIDVVQVVNVATQKAVVRELALIKVAATDTQVQEIQQYAQRFDAHIVDTTNETVIVEQRGSSEQINELVQQLASYGIREIVRSGGIVMPKDM